MNWFDDSDDGNGDGRDEEEWKNMRDGRYIIYISVLDQPQGQLLRVVLVPQGRREPNTDVRILHYDCRVLRIITNIRFLELDVG